MGVEGSFWPLLLIPVRAYRTTATVALQTIAGTLPLHLMAEAVNKEHKVYKLEVENKRREVGAPRV